MPPANTIVDAINRGLRLVDGRTGIIQGLFDLPLETNDPQLFHIAAPLADTSKYYGTQCYRHNGGAALTRERAAISAIGEAVERYCGGFYDPDSLIKAKPRELDSLRVCPWDFALFTDEQYERKGFPMSRPVQDTVFRWVKGRSLVRGVDVYVPAAFVYVPYSFESRAEFITLPISTGLACGSTLEDAILRGLYEVVERDSFAITWLNRLPVPRLLIDRIRSKELNTVMEKFAEANLNISVSLATSDLGIPVVITVSTDDTGAGPASVIAARADFDLEHAVLRSVEETAQTRLWGRKLMRDRPHFEPGPDYGDIVEGGDHVRLYCDKEMRQHLSFLLDAHASVNISDYRAPTFASSADCLHECVNTLAAKGYDVIVVDVTTADIEEVGFHVVRVIIPGLQPMDMDHNWRYLGGRRLYEAPAAMGYPKNMDGFNPIPHPFP